MKHLTCLVLAASISLLTPSVRADIVIDVLVPAYANPCCDGGPNMWNSLIATAGDSNRNYDIHAIFNPASGPGASRDPNYLNASGAGPLTDFRNAGGITHGYVATRLRNPVTDMLELRPIAEERLGCLDP